MALDAYTACPCGSGKKIKFCAPKNTNAEMEKIIRAIEGDQRASALDQVKRLIAKHPDSHCLMSIRTDLEQTLGFDKEWRESVAEMLEKLPHEPGAHFRQSIVYAVDGELEKALDAFHEGLFLRSDDSPLQLVAIMAINNLAELSLVSGAMSTAGQLLFLRQGLLRAQKVRDEQFIAFLRDAQIPRAFKRIWTLPPAPADAAWKTEYDVAIQQFQRLRFRDALAILKSLATKVKAEPLILRSITALEQMLGREAEALSALKEYIASGGTDEDDLVDALALAYWLDEDQDTIEHVRLTYSVADIDKVRACLTNQNRLQQFEIGPELTADENTPPPQLAAHWFAEDLDMDAEQVAGELAAVIMYYGRQTDRDARLEVDIAKDNRFDDQIAAITQHFGDSIGESPQEEVISQVTLLGHISSRRARGVKITSLEFASAAQDEQHRKCVEEWLTTPADCLNGKSPQEASSDEQLTPALRAYFYNLQGIADADNWLHRVEECRDQLAFARPAAMAVGDLRVGVNKISDIDLGQLEDQDLLQMTSAFDVHGLVGSQKNAFREILTRPSLKSEVSQGSVYMMLARLCQTGEALKYAHLAQAALKEEGQSPADALLLELNIQLMSGKADEVRKLLSTIEANHINEPGVVEELQNILSFGGRVDPTAMGEAAEAAPASDESSGELWTPDSGPTSDDSGGEPSKLWVPGMD